MIFYHIKGENKEIKYVWQMLRKRKHENSILQKSIQSKKKIEWKNGIVHDLQKKWGGQKS